MVASAQAIYSAVPQRKAGPAQGIVVVFAAFLPILAIVALAPVVPRLVEAFAGVPGAATLVPLAVVAPGLMIALFSPLMGWLADRYGRRRLLLVSTFCYGIVGVAPYFLLDLKAIFASRLAMGLCEAAILTVTNTLIGDYYEHDERRRWLTIQGLVGPVFGTSTVALAGYMAAVAWQIPFLIYLIAFPILLGMVAFIFEPQVVTHAEGSAERATPFPWRHVIVTSLVTFFCASLYYVYIVQIGLGFAAIGINDPSRVGLLISLASIGVFIGAILFQIVSGRFSFLVQIGIFLALLGVGLCGIGLSHSQAMMTGSAFVQQLGAGILIPALVLWTVAGLPVRHRGRGMGIWSGSFFLGQFGSPLIVTLTSGFVGSLLGTFAVLGVLALAGSTYAFVKKATS